MTGNESQFYAMDIAKSAYQFGQQDMLEKLLDSSASEDDVDAVTYPFSRVGLWWITRKEIVVCDRPEALHYDPIRRELHCEDGPTVRWRDGTSLYHWHGRSIPPWIIEEEYGVKQALEVANVEVRRCALEKIGWDNVLKSVGTMTRSVPDPGNPGQRLNLWKCDGIEEYAMLECTNATVERDGTRRKYILTVPHRFANPVAAAAWTFGTTVKKYSALARAT